MIRTLQCATPQRDHDLLSNYYILVVFSTNIMCIYIYIYIYIIIIMIIMHRHVYVPSLKTLVKD